MQISFILVEPAIPENIGAAARAINTMGFSELLLVNPADHLSDKARMLAHGSQHILEQATTYETLEMAIQSFDFIIGTSAKARSVKVDYVPADMLLKELQKKSAAVKNIALVFGREESGLTNPEIQLCDWISYIDLKNPYPSLNLSQAVMLYAYQLRIFAGNISSYNPPEALNAHSYKALKIKVEELLVSLEFEKAGTIYNRIMERLSAITSADVNLLHSILEKVNTKLEQGIDR